MPDLPHDVWCIVAQNLSPSRIHKLMPTNRAFLNIALDQKYRNIEWVQLDENIGMYLKRLQDPFVAVRVRRLHIRAWFIQYLLQREKLFEGTLSNKFRKLLGRKPPAVAGSEHISVLSRFGKLSSSQKLLRYMGMALIQMVSVIEYRFEWGDLVINDATRDFIASTRRAFTASLFKLSLRARISQLKHFLPFADFPHLAELELRFEYDPSDGGSPGDDVAADHNNEKTLVASVAPSINALARSLRILIIASLGKGDHAPFLDALGPLPKLHSLTLRLSFTHLHLSDPSPITKFLNAHRSTLETIEVCPHPPERILHTIPFATSQPYYPPQNPRVVRVGSDLGRQWLQDTVWVGNATRLAIPAFDHRATLELLRSAAGSRGLRKLRLMGRYMTLKEMEEILVALSPCQVLSDLSIEIDELSVEVIKLLARNLPNLSSLTLVLGVDNFNLLSSRLLVSKHRSQRVDWALHDLSIYYKQVRDESIVIIPETSMEERFMNLIGEQVLPGLMSFKGRRHTRYQHYYY
ncbi:hypothetical protein DXG01_005552 [Tephrocybe rancida]|nr:hypothetical protein DXG01_005552 [Tephrocybe rancida]